ncbi:hypothetical protein DEH84_00130 [Aquabacterium olei]|uniref:ATP-binding protein n=1 Tax=Aquabacterium olei TaxID=1296669 RepID=A0A2U8FM05_9BURK|nr:ATP-binding protein [Aquabacterium olei]AWI52029.1 hypothetical protein DEH84_00130 [Aquabacterium olei]
MAKESIKRKMLAGRICDAIAAIGYTNASAIMDIVDNSVSAGSTKVDIYFELEDTKTFSDKSNVLSVKVIDNGCGMDEERLCSALDIGSLQDYPENSLSKYGFGLKSAGFSLGPCISIVSKKGGSITRVASVDKRKLQEDYIVDLLDEGSFLDFASAVLTGDSGTAVEVSGCQDKNHDSAKKTIDLLAERLGVTYAYFLDKKESPLEIYIHSSGRPAVKVTSRDILHRDKCISEFDKDRYDCLQPILRKDIELPVSDDPAVDPLRLEVVIFPPRKMHTNPALSPEQRSQILSYDVSRKNKGFFIYRNDRLIRWADDLDGLVGKDDLLVRARLRTTTAHDDILHVDVSKQNLFVPEDVYSRIEKELRIPLREMEDVRKRCDEILASEEGQPFNVRNQDLAPQDEEGPRAADDKAEARRRRNELAKRTREKLSQQGEVEDPPEQVVDSNVPLFQRVRYSDKVGLTLWEMGEDASEGTFVRINTNHSFYRTVLSSMSEDAAARQSIEGLLWCAAVGEAFTLEHMKLPPEEIEAVLSKFKKVLSSNLDTWCSNNQDLFGNA